MPALSKISQDRLATCHEDLQKIVNDAIQTYDFSVVCGERSKEDQDKAVVEGKSRTPYPTSRHNTHPSEAVDLIPYPTGYSDLEKFKELADVIKASASKFGIEIEWGGDWKTFIDRPHFQLKKRMI